MKLMQGIEPRQQTTYPVIETEVLDLRTTRRYVVTSCCFQDLFSASDGELAGMGLAVIGNLLKLLRNDAKQHPWRQWEPFLYLRFARQAEQIPLPWPGLESENPRASFTPDALPFDAAMFLGDDQEFRKRVDRLALMARIESSWVPYVKRLLWEKL